LLRKRHKYSRPVSSRSGISRSVILLTALLLSACSTVNFDYPKQASFASEEVADTDLGEAYDDWTELHGENSGFYPLIDGIDALGARLRLIEAAEKTIDAQYFLMKGDTAGELFAGSLLRAADRGVRVRILLDDVFTTVKDDELALLNQHPNIEVRLFNPISRRGIYYLNYAGDFKRANRRMHSKSFIVDNSLSVIGGRNIADEYFQLKEQGEFLDFDVLTIGPVTRGVSAQFDDFWNATKSLPMEALSQKFSDEDLERVRREIDEEMAAGQLSVYAKAVNSKHMLELVNGSAKLYTGAATVVNDTSEKLSNPVGEQYMTLVNQLEELTFGAEKDIVIINPYFIPTEAGLEYWRKIIDRGIDVTIITNSLSSTNHVTVHSAYTRYRKPMVESGATIYEARSSKDNPRTLHTKLVINDRRYVFVGSLNLDPRSIDINAEMGVVIDSPELAADILDGLEEALESEAWQLKINDKGGLDWHLVSDGQSTLASREPDSSAWERFLSVFYRILPEGQL